MEFLLTYAGNFGFPALLAIYLLVRLESKLDNLTRSIQQLYQLLDNDQEELLPPEP